MEIMTFQYKASKVLPRRAHVGVVGSGDLEILIEPIEVNEAKVLVRTRFDGYQQVWQKLLDRFFAEHDLKVNIEINDFGATPGLISMRLLQALEVSYRETDEA